MYAVIEDSGQQFRVREGDILDVDLRDLPEGSDTIEFPRVLLVREDDQTRVGTPVLDGASVSGEILDPEKKGPKVHHYAWRRRKASKRKTGHRQKYIRVRITSISA